MKIVLIPLGDHYVNPFNITSLATANYGNRAQTRVSFVGGEKLTVQGSMAEVKDTILDLTEEASS